MNTVSIVALTPNGKSALKGYCEKFRRRKQSFRAKLLRRAAPYTEEVDDVENPSRVVVILGKALQSRAEWVVPQIYKNIFNILGKFGGKPEDFEVKFE